MTTKEYLLLYPGFSAQPGVCHLVASTNRNSRRALVGSPEDNPGTSVTNALENVAQAVSNFAFGGSPDFVLYQYEPRGIPDLRPTFMLIEWKGPHPFSMPVWHRVDPLKDRWLSEVRRRVEIPEYRIPILRRKQGVEILDATASGVARRELGSQEP